MYGNLFHEILKISMQKKNTYHFGTDESMLRTCYYMWHQIFSIIAIFLLMVAYKQMTAPLQIDYSR